MIKKLKLTEIVTDAGTQVRAGLNDATVAEYAEALAEGAKFPPVVVFHDGSRYLAADGFHRIAAALRIGVKVMEAEVRKGGKTEALKFALGCNAHHGLRRTNADKRHAVELALKEFPKLSDRALAEMCVVCDTFVGDIRRESGAVKPHLPPPARIGKDGKEYRLPPPPMTRGDAARHLTPSPHPQPLSHPMGEGGSGLSPVEAEREKEHRAGMPGSPAGRMPAATPPPPGPMVDATGWAIPTQLIPLWQRTGEVQEMLTTLSRVKGALRTAQETKDTLFAEVNFSSALSQLDQAWYDIKTAKPFAVCPTCQGQLPDQCRLCHGRGFVSEHRWNTCVTREDKEFRQRAKSEIRMPKSEGSPNPESGRRKA